jgi:hypothetical protein
MKFMHNVRSSSYSLNEGAITIRATMTDLLPQIMLIRMLICALFFSPVNSLSDQLQYPRNAKNSGKAI